MKRPAVFFDRDNTLIVSDGYLGDPSKVVLVDGAADAVARARSLGYAVVVFSNQSGVARGMFSEDDVHRVNAKVDEMLLDQNPSAVIDRHEFCPYHPEGTVEPYAKDSDLRKPKPGMILQAAEKLALDLARSWVIGDAPRDIESGKAAGCKTIWYKDPKLPPSMAARELMLVVPDAVVSTLKEATDVIAREALLNRSTNMNEAPPAAPEPAAPAPTLHLTAPAEPETPPQPERDEPSVEPESPPEVRRTSAAGPRSVATAKPLAQILAQKRTAAQSASGAQPPQTPAAQTQAPVAPAMSTARIEELAEQILQELQRREHHVDADFSISKLLAGIIQVIAVTALVLAWFLYRANPEPALLVALFLQTLTIALLIMGRQR
jgi:D-glycero-D-manno-heptose 1,7-bisphosphate phosphatase